MEDFTFADDTIITPTDMAMVKVNPEADVVVEEFYQEALSLRESATITAVQSLEDIKVATDTLSMIQTLKRAMEDKRKEYVSPLQGYVKAINDTFKGLMVPIEEADRIIRNKILAFQKAEDDKRREQERINRLRIEAAEAEKKLTGEVSEPVELVKPDEPLPERITTDTGEVGSRTIRKWEMENFALLPDEYKTPDTVKIGKLVRNGIPSIPGVRIYEEKVLTVEAGK